MSFVDRGSETLLSGRKTHQLRTFFSAGQLLCRPVGIQSGLKNKTIPSRAIQDLAFANEKNECPLRSQNRCLKRSLSEDETDLHGDLNGVPADCGTVRFQIL
jgi:hypothetical protein